MRSFPDDIALLIFHTSVHQIKCYRTQQHYLPVPEDNLTEEKKKKKNMKWAPQAWIGDKITCRACTLPQTYFVQRELRLMILDAWQRCRKHLQRAQMLCATILNQRCSVNFPQTKERLLNQQRKWCRGCGAWLCLFTARRAHNQSASRCSAAIFSRET